MTSPYLLLVEDNPDDVFIMQRAITKTGLAISARVATDGKEAVEFLKQAAESGDAESPGLPLLVFLDLKLPYLNGFEVLSFIRQHQVLQNLEVIILTSSAEERDAKRANELRASAYLVKPPKPEVLVQKITPLLNRSRDVDVGAGTC